MDVRAAVKQAKTMIRKSERPDSAIQARSLGLRQGIALHPFPK